MPIANYMFQGPGFLTTTTLINCPCVYVVFNRIRQPYRFLDVGLSDGGYPLNCNTRFMMWNCMSIGNLYYAYFPTPPEKYSMEERRVIVEDLILICKPRCLN